MPAFRKGTVTAVLSERPGLQKVEVDRERAYVLTQLTGSVSQGDEVLLNTTAVDLRLGTGRWHFVHWNLSRDEFEVTGPGHIMKLRYTSLQADTGAAEEHAGLEVSASLSGTPVVVLPLHSLLAPVVVALKDLVPEARIAYVMTDASALPVALSDLVHDLVSRKLVDLTITAGQAFGGDLEAVNSASGMHLGSQRADIVVVGMGPGNVGTSSTLGFASLEIANLSDNALSLGGVATVCLRWSDVDPRARHQGLSHHLVTALRMASRPTNLAVPAGDRSEEIIDVLEREGLADLHRVVTCDAPDAVGLLERHGLHVTSMGHPLSDDPIFAQMGSAAATVAAAHLDAG
ncbi:MAG: DUF3866 family protein, partial [Acidimicrobiales bacterium]